MSNGTSAQAESRVRKALQMGLGEAIQRLMRVEVLLQQGLARVPESSKAERQLILDALNTSKLDLGFDCDDDGVPETVEIFKKSAETSCCRIVPADTSRSAPAASSRRGVKSTSSRRKKKDEDNEGES
jgi:hypothetical protein